MRTLELTEDQAVLVMRALCRQGEALQSGAEYVPATRSRVVRAVQQYQEVSSLWHSMAQGEGVPLIFGPKSAEYMQSLIDKQLWEYDVL